MPSERQQFFTLVFYRYLEKEKVDDATNLVEQFVFDPDPARVAEFIGQYISKGESDRTGYLISSLEQYLKGDLNELTKVIHKNLKDRSDKRDNLVETLKGDLASINNALENEFSAKLLLENFDAVTALGESLSEEPLETMPSERQQFATGVFYNYLEKQEVDDAKRLAEQFKIDPDPVRVAEFIDQCLIKENIISAECLASNFQKYLKPDSKKLTKMLYQKLENKEVQLAQWLVNNLREYLEIDAREVTKILYKHLENGETQLAQWLVSNLRKYLKPDSKELTNIFYKHLENGETQLAQWLVSNFREYLNLDSKKLAEYRGQHEKQGNKTIVKYIDLLLEKPTGNQSYEREKLFSEKFELKG